jgi:hypothetical protein
MEAAWQRFRRRWTGEGEARWRYPGVMPEEIAVRLRHPLAAGLISALVTGAIV